MNPLNLLIVLRANLKASVEQTASEMKVVRIRELEVLEWRLEAKNRRSQEISSISIKQKAQL